MPDNPFEAQSSERKVSPEEKYLQALEKAAALGRQWNRSQASGESFEAEYGKINELNAALAERLALIRRIEGLRNIGDVSSGVKAFEARVKDIREARERIEAEISQTADPNRAEELSRRLGQLPNPEGLVPAQEELADFRAKRNELARKNGYAPAGDEGEFGLYRLQKERLRFGIMEVMAPVKDGIAGPSRILKMEVAGISDSRKKYFDYERHWNIACEDPEIQREIDRLVAVFG